MNKLAKANKKIEKTVVSGYKAIENSVVSSYRAIEDGVVGGYKKIENKFVEAFLTPDSDSSQRKLTQLKTTVPGKEVRTHERSRKQWQ